MTRNKTQGSSIAQNKKARHYYELLEFFEAGIVLSGSEIKSIRQGEVNFRDSYVTFRNGEAFIIGLHIAPYANAGQDQHDPDQDRKLLLHTREIESLAERVEQKGLSVVPVNLHFTHGRVKVEIALGRGRKLHDHRDALKSAAELRDAQREMSRY